jgi:hypothetical protein
MLDIILWIPSIRPSSHDFVVVCHMWLLMVLYYAFMTIWLCVWIMFLFVIKQCMHISEPSESIKLLKCHLLKCSTLNCKGNTLAKFEFAQCPCSILCSPMRLSYATYFKSISTIGRTRVFDQGQECEEGDERLLESSVFPGEVNV